MRPTGSRPTGFYTLHDRLEDAVEKECDTFTCQHCSRLVKVKPFCSPSDIEFGGQCKGCMGLICLRCYDIPGCDHIERKLERAESRKQFFLDISK
jgi:hypothetical protein